MTELLTAWAIEIEAVVLLGALFAVVCGVKDLWRRKP